MGVHPTSDTSIFNVCMWHTNMYPIPYTGKADKNFDYKVSTLQF